MTALQVCLGLLLLSGKRKGPVPALYPTPLVVVGAYLNGKPTWTLAGHLGIIGHDHIMVSLEANWKSGARISGNNVGSLINQMNQGIKEINL